MSFKLNIRQRIIEMNAPAIMGVVNRSQDSFYNPSKSLAEALTLVEQMITEGVDIIDVGAEATNLYTQIKDDYQQEIKLISETVAAIRQRFSVLISVDTRHPQVMQAAVAAGADMINDQRALQQPGALTMAAQLQVPVCLMHWLLGRQPGSTSPQKLLQQIKIDLKKLTDQALQAGLNQQQIIIDPGFGQGHFGKNVEENFYLLKHLAELQSLGFPILVGWSRKSMIGDVLGDVPVSQRLYGSIAAATIAALQGANIIRVHDVKATADALRVVRYYKE